MYKIWNHLQLTEASSPLIVIKCGFYMQLVLELQRLITSLREHLAFMCIVHTLWLLVSSNWTSTPWFGSQAIFIWEKEKNSQCLQEEKNQLQIKSYFYTRKWNNKHQLSFSLEHAPHISILVSMLLKRIPSITYYASLLHEFLPRTNPFTYYWHK